MAEGAGILVLEELEHAKSRGAHIYAEVSGYGNTCDSYHYTAPRPDGRSATNAMRLALAEASFKSGENLYINAHGTGTVLGDVAEGTAIAEVFGGGHPPISTIKGYTGHTLGACGAVEAALTIEMMRASWFAPNLNLDDPDPACGEHDYITGTGRCFDAEFAMSNNFAFGGVNTSLVFRRP